jgi:Ca-activated chloride channel family protein
MSDFRFANPEGAVGLWVVLAIVVVLLWLERRRGDALSRFVLPGMQSRLVARPALLRRVAVIILLGISAACLVLAWMRPQHGLTYVKSPRVGAQIMFCLDVSKSMLAEDTAPNRLDRAKAEIADLLTFLDGDPVGLIGFAGRASVLCPLTPDYGFFKLILDSANPSSVGRGGTRLEEPIRKALDGFRSQSDVSRVIFLITDGEDQDSHPLDAAKEAVERGIKVVAVGLGDEAGSEIRMTDPRTGVQSQVLDADGRPVVTRLDGETLRELALATEGVYIPAGTGSLDLKSIYDAHIKPLMRGEIKSKGRAIRQDAYQWPLLAGLISLILSVVLSSGRGDANVEPSLNLAGAAKRAAMLVAISMFSLPGQVPAQHPAPSMAPASKDANQASPAAKFDAEPIDPRRIYNQGSEQLQSDLDRAETLLTQARREAAGDGEVRFRATYNTGWLEINRADALIEQQPEQALKHLQLAAGWFRDAVRLRGDSPDARHNLEVVLLRILQLRDRLS